MRFGVSQERIGIAAKGLYLVLVAMTVGLGGFGVVYFSQNSSAAAPNVHSSSASLGSSTYILTSSSSGVQAAAHAPASQYTLVWGPKAPSACGAGAFCIAVTLGFSGQTATTNNTSASATTIIQGNATTIIDSSTTTIIRSNGSETDYVKPVPIASYYVVLTAFVQDAVTGQNATTPYGGGPLIQNACYIQPTGFTHCLVSAWFLPTVASGDSYKVTVFVTKANTPCSLQKGQACSSQLLAPPSQTVTVPGD